MTFLQRFLGVIFFRPAAYRHVASNPSLNNESSLIVIIVAFLNSAVYIWLNGFSLQQSVLSRLVIPIIIGWIFTGWLRTWIAGMLFKVKIPLSNILRAEGYARIYGLLGIFITVFGTNSAILSVTTLLGAIASIIATRESGEMSTWQAIGIFLLTFFGTTIVTMPILLIFGISQKP